MASRLITRVLRGREGIRSTFMDVARTRLGPHPHSRREGRESSAAASRGYDPENQYRDAGRKNHS